MDPSVYQVKYGGHRHLNEAGVFLNDLVAAAIQRDWRAIQFFLGPDSSHLNRRTLTSHEVTMTNDLCLAFNFQCYTHFPYKMNLCKPQSARGLSGLNQELLEMGKIGGRIVVHPNSPAVKNGPSNSVSKEVYIGGDGDKLKKGCCEELTPKYGAKCARVCEEWVVQCDTAIDALVENLGKLRYAKNQQKYQLLLEGCASEGQKICGTLEQMKAIATRVKHLPVGFCLDTCHCYASGLSKFDTIEAIDQFFKKLEDLKILEMVKLIHLNDSSDEFFSCKDRHEALGYGKIWGHSLKPLERLAYYCTLHKIDVICEIGSSSDFEICHEIFKSR
ncbi:Ribonuclease [uncultured virus]|nr:Ribonuclease [uncultured virus]